MLYKAVQYSLAGRRAVSGLPLAPVVDLHFEDSDLGIPWETMCA